MSDFPFRLKPEDAPPLPDPQTALAEHQATLRALADDASYLVKLLTHWANDPIGVLRRAQTQALELAEQVHRAEISGETAARACRNGGLLSAKYENGSRG